jgi:hypothetical protein
MGDHAKPPDVVLVEAVGRAQRMFSDLGTLLQQRDDVRDIIRAVDFSAGSTIDLFTDAELTNGEYTIRSFPSRHAVGPEDLANELVAAAKMVTAILPAGSGMFPGEGYGG